MSQIETTPPLYYSTTPQVGSGWTGGNIAGGGQLYPSYGQQQTFFVQPLPQNRVFASTGAADAEHHHGYKVYNKRGLRMAGETQIVVGCFAIVLDIIASSLGRVNYGIGFFSGLWSGVFFIIAGALGISAVYNNSRSRVIGMLVFSIFSCALAVLCIAFLSIQIRKTPNVNNTDVNYNSARHFYYYTYYITRTPLEIAVVTLSAFAIVFVIIEGIASIVQSSYGCCEICPRCCCPRNSIGPQIDAQMHIPHPVTNYGKQQYPVLITASNNIPAGGSFYPQQQFSNNLPPYGTNNVIITNN